MLLAYIIISFINVFLHIVRSIAVIKSSKLSASAIVIKFIAEVDLLVAIAVQATTNFVGCYAAMWYCEKFMKKASKQ